MSDFDKQPTDAATRKPNNVGSRGEPAFEGGHQTAQQAAITGIDPGGAGVSRPCGGDPR